MAKTAIADEAKRTRRRVRVVGFERVCEGEMDCFTSGLMLAAAVFGKAVLKRQECSSHARLKWIASQDVGTECYSTMQVAVRFGIREKRREAT